MTARAAASWSSLVLYLQFTRMTFLQMLAYRLRYYTGIATYLVFVAGNSMLYRAVYASLPVGASIGGYDVNGVVGYVAIAWIGRSLVFNKIDREIAVQVVASAVVRATGIAGTATVDKVADTGEIVGDERLFTMEVTVRLPGEPDRRHDASAAMVPLAAADKVRVGLQVPVRVARDNPNVVLFEWEKLGPPTTMI